MNKPLTFEEWWQNEAMRYYSDDSVVKNNLRTCWIHAQANMPQHTDAQWIERGTSPETYDCEAPFWFYDTRYGVGFCERDTTLKMNQDTTTHYIPGDNNGHIPKPPVLKSEAEKAWEEYKKSHGSFYMKEEVEHSAKKWFIDAFTLGKSSNK